MTDPLLLLPILASFFVTLFLIPRWINKAKNLNLTWPDMNKYSKPLVVGSAGLIAVLGFVIGLLIYVAYRVFVLNSHNSLLVELLALLAVTLMIAGIGFVDDLFGWKKGGLRRRHRIILTGLASIPLIAINAGKSIVSFPFIGAIDLGLIYPLLIIPLGIVGAATTFNFLAGFNGLESGQGIILLLSVGLVAFLTGNTWLAVVALIMVFALIGFLAYNFFPAKVFPGDSLTYSVGALVAMIAILGNFERIAIFFFIPYILEFTLKSRGKLVKQSFGKPNKDGSLDLQYKKLYSLNHVSIFVLKKLNIKPTELKVVFSIWMFQLIIIILGFIFFYQGIFK